jgi:hypothetical protein
LHSWRIVPGKKFVNYYSSIFEIKIHYIFPLGCCQMSEGLRPSGVKFHLVMIESEMWQ